MGDNTTGERTLTQEQQNFLKWAQANPAEREALRAIQPVYGIDYDDTTPMKTGTDLDAGTFTWYNPERNTYFSKPLDPDDPFANEIGGDTFAWGWTPEGDRVVTKRPEAVGLDPDQSYYAPVGDNHWDLVVGQPDPSPYQPPSGHTDPIFGGIDREVPLPPDTSQGYTPETPWQNEGPGYVPPIYQQRDDFQAQLPPEARWSGAPIQPDLGQPAFGGATSLEEFLGDKAADRIGFESSTNRDFYQDQFAKLRNQQTVQNMKEAAAAIRRGNETQGEPFGGDPWSWTELPDVQLGTGAPSQVATGQYELNPRYDWNAGTAGSRVIADLLPTLSDQEQVFLNKHRDYFDNLDLSSRQTVQDWAAGNPYTGDKGWTTVVNEIANQIYQPIYDSRGPQAPVGYAAPVNL